MKKTTAWILFACSLLFLETSQGADYMKNASESRLSNGMKVIFLESRKAPVVSFQVWYRAGSRNDWWGKSGLAHVFEHLMFKGTEKVPKEAFTRRIQEIGGNYNAMTSHDFAAYFENVASDSVEVPIRLEADRMQNLEFTKEDFETEKKVVMEERRLRTQDQPKSYLYEQYAATAFQAQPYHWPPIGWMGDLLRIDHEDALRFYRTYYAPSNAFIVVVGDFQKDETLQVIEEAFGDIPAGDEPEHHRYEDPPQTGERRVVVHREASLPYVILGYHVPNLSHEDSHVLEVIAALLSSGKSARLYENIVLGKTLAISAGAEYSLLSVDPPLFQLYAEPLPGKGAEQLEAALVEEVERLRNRPVGDRELQKAKNQLEAAFVFGRDSLFFQGMLLARYEIAAGWENIRNYLPSIRQVTADDIQRVAEKYFHSRNRTVGILKPVEASPGSGDGRKNKGSRHAEKDS